MTSILYITQILLLVLLSLASVGILFLLVKIYGLLSDLRRLLNEIDAERQKNK